MLRRGAQAALLILALITAFASPLSDPSITVPYTVQGGSSTGYTAIPYMTEANFSTGYTAIPYAVQGQVGVSRPVAPSYTYIAGVSTSYSPLVYRINTELVIRNINWTVPLRVHVRLLKANKTYIPDFDVDYTVNGTLRTARRGEDAFNLTLSYFEAYWRDPVVLVFPDAVEGHRLLNSTTIIIDPFVTQDVYVYYYAEVTEPIKPTVPTTPTPTSTTTPTFPRGYITIPWQLLEIIESYWWLLILTLVLIIVAYVYHKRYSGVSVVINIPNWAIGGH